MALSTDELTAIDALLSGADSDASPIPHLRQRFPGLSWTACDASDVAEPPFRVYSRFEMHLLNSSDHCSQITPDPAEATGIILARRSPQQ
jgi:hypothetical protein